MSREYKYIIENPVLMEEWDWIKNNELGMNPGELTYSSKKEVFWRCKNCGHSWSAMPNSRNRIGKGTGCPRCARISAVENYRATKLAKNSLAVKRPDLLEEWDYELNGDLMPTQVTFSTAQKVWWRCKVCNQSWFAKVAGRNIGRGCPVCAGQKLVVGVNDLATVNPKLAAEWDYERNDITPQQISARNNVSAAWVCSLCGHRWKALVSSRNRGTGCPQCQKNFQISFPEYVVYHYVKLAFNDAISGYKLFEGRGAKKADIFIPSLGLAVEYDGGRWHKNTETDMKKTTSLVDRGLSLVRLRETTCPPLSDGSTHILVEYNPSDYGYLTPAILSLFEFLRQNYCVEISVPVDVTSDFCAILDAYETSKKEKSLAAVNPEVAAEWDYNKNYPLTPDKVSATTEKKFYWLCKKCGYSWKATVYDRNSGHSCQFCAGKALWIGVNDLQTKRPALVAEWDFAKNGVEVRPESIAYRSDRKVWWLCQKCGHSWQARIADRSNGIGCPACAGKVVRAGVTDLATINPSLTSQWDYEKNGSLTPQMVTGGSNKKAWWVCDNCGHSWQAYIYSRHIYGRGCPKCRSKHSNK